MLARFRLLILVVVFAVLATTFLLNGVRIDQQWKIPGTGGGSPAQSDPVHSGEDNSQQAELSDSTACIIQPDWLKDLSESPDIKFPLKYARRDIVVREQPGLERSSITKVEDVLLPDFQEIRSPEEFELKPKSCLPPLVLDVPVTPPKVDAKHILFGMATTIERLDASIPYIQRWLSNSGARLVVDIKGNDDKAPDKEAMADLGGRMRELGMLVTLVPPFEKKGNNVQRYLSLVKTLYEHKDEDTDWFAFVDDDTFFTSMSGLVDRLSRYDAQEQLYLGAVSEEWWTVVQYGWIAMGGGGIFLSEPLAAVLHENYAECKAKVKRIFGDHQIYECISQYTDVRLTVLDGLYQIDLHGDRSGVFESGRQILSQHHWKEGYWSEDGAGLDAIRHPRWFPLDKMSLVSDLCGDTCFLQRWQFGKDAVLTNGYSLAVYPKGHLKDLDLFKMEQTWVTPTEVKDSLNKGYDHYTGPMRPALKLDKEKVHYRFMDAQVIEGGGLRQFFRHLGKNGELDTLVELHWTKSDG